ncbi:MAG TPA: hypothetical protein VL049_11990 [Candidatus Dormibacteraeota bacterium]|nr:hypothetical protein [Candidatus Dormibacteraeota bacterium]
MPTSRVRWADRAAARLLLILSSERSSSTLLRFLLGEHSRLVSPQELFEYCRLLGQPTSAEAVETACGGRNTVQVYEWMLAQLPPHGILVDKAARPATRQAPEMNPRLGDPNFHQHRQVDAGMADDWLARDEESWLRPELLALMAEVDVRRPRLAAAPSASQTSR